VSDILFKCLFVFFFSSRRRHTRCYRDWSSDVCSSDLFFNGVLLAAFKPWLSVEVSSTTGLRDSETLLKLIPVLAIDFLTRTHIFLPSGLTPLGRQWYFISLVVGVCIVGMARRLLGLTV